MDATHARPRSSLRCEGVELERVGEEAGTPIYVYSAATIRERYSTLDAALSAACAGAPAGYRIHYACKANSNLALLELLRSLGASVDVVSGGELFRARQAGFRPTDMIFGGVGKSRQELEEAVSTGVGIISVESAEEVRLLGEIVGATGGMARVGVRVNPEISVESFHDYIKTGEKGDKFGVPIDTADEVAVLVSRTPRLRLVAVGMHIGSQVSGADSWAAGVARLESLVRTLRERGIDTLEHIDFGGGLYVPYDGEPPADLAAWAGVIAPAAARLGLSLIVEPGRFLVAESGVLLTRVLYRKRSGGREILVTDAGMNDLLRPSHYAAYHRIEAVTPDGARGRFDVVGPICESGDFLALDREMDDATAGSLLCVFTVGAYGFSMTSNYNARPRAAEVLVDGDRWAVIRERETHEDLVRHELHAPAWRRG